MEVRVVFFGASARVVCFLLEGTGSRFSAPEFWGNLGDFLFFFGVRVKWHGEILFFCSRKYHLFTKPLEEKYAPCISISDSD